MIFLSQIAFLPPVFAKKTKVSTPESEYKYQQKVLRKLEIEKYERSLMPESGYMTYEEYQKASEDIPNSDRVIPEYKAPKDIKMKYVPQYSYKMVRYNDPPGSVDLKIENTIKFNKQVNGGAITSPNRDILVYPVIYYYSSNQCTAGELFVIPLDKSLTDVERILRANVVKRIPIPILSTEKNIDENHTFRTMTPVDFSADGTKLIAKEKIGNSNDGIWQTNLWVYDFQTQEKRNLVEVRDAIRYFWKNSQNIYLDDKRWDIYPLGFDAENPDRLIVNAFGYTGKAPKFLGTWSIDCKGEKTLLISLTDPIAKVGINGFKAVKSEVIDPNEIIADEKKQEKEIKKERKKAKKALKADKKKKKQALNKRLKEMKHEEVSTMKTYNKHPRKHTATAAESPVQIEDAPAELEESATTPQELPVETEK